MSRFSQYAWQPIFCCLLWFVACTPATTDNLLNSSITTNRESKPSLTRLTPTPTRKSLLPATLTVGGQVQSAAIGTNCWLGGCADMSSIPTPFEPMTVTSPFLATLNIPVDASITSIHMNVVQVTVENELSLSGTNQRWWNTWSTSHETRYQITLSLEREQEIKITLEPGLYVLHLFVAWQEVGDANYGFLVKVSGSLEAVSLNTPPLSMLKIIV